MRCLRFDQLALKGRIVFVARGFVGERKLDAQALRTITIYTVLANDREVPVTPVDFFLFLRVDGKWQQEPLRVVHGPMRKGFELEFEAGELAPNVGKHVVVFPTDNSLLTSSIKDPILRAQPRGGALIFATTNVAVANVDRIRLHILDAFGGTHVIEQDTTLKHDPRLLRRLDPSVEIQPVFR